MENILQKTVVAVLLIYLSYVACSQTADEEQGLLNLCKNTAKMFIYNDLWGSE